MLAVNSIDLGGRHQLLGGSTRRDFLLFLLPRVAVLDVSRLTPLYCIFSIDPIKLAPNTILAPLRAMVRYAGYGMLWRAIERYHLAAL